MKAGSIGFSNLIGAGVAIIDNLLIIALLVARLAGKQALEYWLGLVLIASVVPLVYLLVQSPAFGRSTIYYIWLWLMILFLVVELLLDYLLNYNFRANQWMSISYVMLLFGATGGMIGVASMADVVGQLERWLLFWSCLPWYSTNMQKQAFERRIASISMNS